MAAKLKGLKLEPKHNPTKLVELPPGTSQIEKLKCVMCKKFPIFPLEDMYFCLRGHMACTQCFQILNFKGCTKLITKDLICHMKMVTSSKDAQPVLSFFYDNSKFVCSFKGCEEVVQGSELANHLQNCPKGYVESVVCCDTACSPIRKYDSGGMWEHMRRNHSDVFAEGLAEDQFEMQYVKEKCWAEKAMYTKIKHERTIFACLEAFDSKFVIAAEEHQGKFIFFGFVLDGEEEADQFQFSLEILDKRKLPPIVWDVFPFENRLRTDKLKEYAGRGLVAVVDKTVLYGYEPTEDALEAKPDKASLEWYLACEIKLSVVKKPTGEPEAGSGGR